MTSVTKRCGRCCRDLDVGLFNRRAQAKDGLQGRCKSCQGQTKAEWRAANAEKVKADFAAWCRANPDRVREYAAAHMERKRATRTPKPPRLATRPHARKYKYETPEQRALRLAKDAARSAARYAANPASKLGSSGRRRARLRSAPSVQFSPESLSDRLAYFGDKCWMCGAPWEHIDHVKPISKGGAHMLANLRPACASCNQEKKDRWFGPHSLSAFLRQ